MKIIDIPQSGKCGLTVSFNGRNGQVRRAWIVPANPRSPAQMVIRNNLATQAAGFRALTRTQQDAWNAAASGHQSASRLGSSGPLTGLQLFVKLNTTLALFGQPTVVVPTAKPAFPDLAPQNLVITNTGGLIALKLTCPSDPGTNTIVKASKPVSAGIRALPMTKILGVCPAPVLGASDITALYTAAYGAPPVGTQLFVQAFQATDGWESLPTTFSAVVPASA